MQDIDTEYSNRIEQSLKKLRIGDLSGLSDFKEILNCGNSEAILKSASIIKSDLDIIKACFMAFKSCTISGELLDIKGYSFLDNIKPSIVEAFKDGDVNFNADDLLFTLAELFSINLSKPKENSKEVSDSLLYADADMNVVQDFYNKHIFQKKFDDTIRFEDWKNLVDKLRQLKHSMRWISSTEKREQIARVNTCLARLGALHYTIIRMPDINEVEKAKLNEEASKFIGSLDSLTTILTGKDKKTTQIKNIAREVRDLSLTNSDSTQVLSLLKRLEKERVSLDLQLRKICKSAKLAPSNQDSSIKSDELFSSNAKAIRFNQTSQKSLKLKIESLKQTNPSANISDLEEDLANKIKEHEKLIAESKAIFSNFEELFVQYMSFSDLYDVVSEANKKMNLFNKIQVPALYDLYDYKDSVTGEHVVIYANNKLYTVAKITEPGQDRTYRV